MARRKTSRPARSRTGASSGGKEKLYTLTEVARKVKISLPTAQRYKKLHQDRIPAQGKGRSQRYPEEALKVFARIKKESAARRGRPRKKKAAPKKARRARKSAAPRRRRATATQRGGAKLLTLTEISRRTGISYPTCVNYVKRHGDAIPHVGEGRKRRYPVEAVAVFRKLRQQSRRGRRKQAAPGRRPRAVSASAAERALISRVRKLEKSHGEIIRHLRRVLKAVDRPLNVTIKRR